MRIAEFSIRRYGPLGDTGALRPGSFSLVFAHNEQGKTLVVEALLRLLLGKGARGLERIERVDESPQGYLVLRERNGTEHKLPEDGSLTDLWPLTAEDCRNVFVIRNSDLSIAREADFYTGVTDRLTGLRTQEIETVQDQLRAIGRLTAKELRISNAQEDGKLKDRLEGAQELLDEIGTLSARLEEEDFDRMAQRAAIVAERIEVAEQEHERMDLARRREQYRRGREALAALRQAMDEGRALEPFTAEEAQQWRDLERTFAQARKRLKELAAEARQARDQIRQLERDEQEAERELKTLERRLEESEELRLELRDYEEQARAVQQTAATARLAAWGCVGLLALTGLSVAAALLGRPWAMVLGFVFGVPALGCGAVLWWQAHRRGRAAGHFERIRHMASAIGLEAATREQLVAGLRSLDSRPSEARQHLAELRADAKAARERARRIQHKRIPAAREMHSDAAQGIEHLRASSGVQTRDEYKEQLQQKEAMRAAARENAAVLASLFGQSETEEAGYVQHWEQALEPLSQYSDAAPEVEYSEEANAELRQRLEALRREQQELHQAMEHTARQLSGIADRANDILHPEDDHLHADTARDLEIIRQRTVEFIEEQEHRAELARSAIGIFDAIRQGEQQKVADQFGPDSEASRLFAEITDGLYSEVLYRRDEDGPRICVRAADGQVLDARWLSGGGYDQLYLSIRLALGQALLGGEPGFFVMDDPFVKADPVRLRRQLQVLRRIVGRGWQVLYFTAKGELRQALAGDVEAGAVTPLSLPGIER